MSGKVTFTTGSFSGEFGTDSSGNFFINTDGSTKEITMDGAKAFSGPNKIFFEKNRGIEVSSSLIPATNSTIGPAITLGSATAPFKRLEVDHIGMHSPVQNFFIGNLRINKDTISSTEGNSNDRKIILGSQFGTRVGIGYKDPQAKLHVEGDISSSGTYYGYVMSDHPCGADKTSAADMFLGFGPSIAGFDEEDDTNTSTSRLLMPYDGYIHSLKARSESAPGNTTIEFMKVADGVDAATIDTAGSTIGAAQTINMSSAHTMYTFTGSKDVSTFSAGDMLAVSASWSSRPDAFDASLVLMFKVNE